MQYSDVDSPFMDFNLAVSMHNTSGILLTVSYFVFVIGNIVSKNGKYYLMKFKGLEERLWKQSRYYPFGYFK